MTVFCEFTGEPGQWTCSVCGRATKTKSAPHARCPGAARDQSPGLLTKAANLAKAAVKHAANGFRECTADEVQLRLAICVACPQFVERPGSTPEVPSGTCRACGCGCSSGTEILNKLRWASEQCPHGKWGPIEG
jgi:hypothetical protein